MTETLEPVGNETGNTQGLARQLLEQAQAEGVELTGPNGLLNQLTRDVLVNRPGVSGGFSLWEG